MNCKILTALLLACLVVKISSQCSIQSTPTKPALLFSTRLYHNQEDPKKGLEYLIQFIEYYAKMGCSNFGSIIIIWNDPKSPHECNVFKNSLLWKKNVYILHAEQDSPHTSFIIPPWIKEELIIHLADNVILGCQTIKKIADSWREKAYGNMGPIGTRIPTSIYFQKQKGTFSVSPTTKSFFMAADLDISVFSRFTADSYYANITSLAAMRNHSAQVRNCEDIILNFVSNWFFPELSQYMIHNISTKILERPQTLFLQNNHFENRDECINKFSYFINENPIKTKPIDENKEGINQESLKKLTNQCILSSKAQNIEENFMDHSFYYLSLKGIYTSKLTSEFEKNVQDDHQILKLPYETKEQMIQKREIQTKYYKTVQRQMAKEEKKVPDKEIIPGDGGAGGKENLQETIKKLNEKLKKIIKQMNKFKDRNKYLEEKNANLRKIAKDIKQDEIDNYNDNYLYKEKELAALKKEVVFMIQNEKRKCLQKELLFNSEKQSMLEQLIKKLNNCNEKLTNLSDTFTTKLSSINQEYTMMTETYHELQHQNKVNWYLILALITTLVICFMYEVRQIWRNGSQISNQPQPIGGPQPQHGESLNVNKIQE